MSCHCHNEINRDGSSQLGRYLKALDPKNAPVDSRNFEDLLVFAKRYANEIRFYDLPGTQIQDDDLRHDKISWKEFFRRDMAVIAASISVVDLFQIKKDYDEIREKLEIKPTQEKFAELFNPITGIVERTYRWYQIAIPENPLHNDLKLAIDSNLREQLKKMIAYAEGFKPGMDTKKTIDHKKVDDILNDWGFTGDINSDSSIYEGDDEDEQLLHAALYVDDIFLSFYEFISWLVERSKYYMQFALEQYPEHQPHMALFISFLQLFKLAQDQMNGLTEKMLNFYYRDVLRLAEKPSIPDRVHIIFELAKDITEYPLEEGVSLSAGKDISGKEQLYKIEHNVVINQAKVKQLSTVFIEKVKEAEPSKNINIEAIYARPIANSLDGFGKAFTDPNPKWPAFGKGKPQFDKNLNDCDKISLLNELVDRHDQAQIGFAIASPQLVLQGGKRILKVGGLSDLISAVKNSENPFEIWLTGEKGWFKIEYRMTPEEYSKLNKYLDLELGIINPKSELKSSYYLTEKEVFIYLPNSENAIVKYDNQTHIGFNNKTEYPIVKVLINESINLSKEQYNTLNSTGLSVTTIVGSINPKLDLIPDLLKKLKTTDKDTPDDLFEYHFDGLSTPIIQTENEFIVPGKTFDPFTTYPAQGKFFFIGSEEVFNKPLGKLAVNLNKTQQADFSIKGESDEVFKVSVLQNRSWDQLSSEDGLNFDQEKLTCNILNHSKKAPEDGSNSIIVDNAFTLERKPIKPITGWQMQTTKGFLQIVYLKETPTDLQDRQKMAIGQEIKEIFLNYRSDLTSLDPNIDQFFHVYPFGVVETLIEPEKINDNIVLFSNFKIKTTNQALPDSVDGKGNLPVNAKYLLLPQFTFTNPYDAFDNILNKDVKPVKVDGSPEVKVKSNDVTGLMLASSVLRKKFGDNLNQYSGSIQEEGMLFIGIENLKPLQTISMLFQFAEGSAEDEDNDPPKINWSYLSNNELRPLDGENIVSDGTYGFQTTGIVKIDVPEDATDANTMLPAGLTWLCASVTENSNRIPQLVNVFTQAAEAKFEDHENDPSHFDKALAAGSISKLTNAVAEVGKVEQPFSSFDGKHREVGKEFYQRVSERLRHKGRAINAWDYEHLVLDRFPSIYKVKCIPHTDPNCYCRHPNKNNTSAPQTDCCGPQVAPGHVLLIPIADIKNRNAANPLQPKTSRRTLLEIEDYIKRRTSPFVHVHAKNPLYEQIIVFFKVKFKKDIDKGYYLKKLNDDIVHFMTPWAFDGNAEVKFGQKIYASSIINFIEESSYVDFITDFLMGVCYYECCPEDVTKTIEKDIDPQSELADKLSKGCGCEDPVYWLKGTESFFGEVVAKPSTSRSILVSVPKHIIIPYIEPKVVSPCEAIRVKPLSALTSIKELSAEKTKPAVKPEIIVAPSKAKASELPKEINKRSNPTVPKKAPKKKPE